MFKMLLGATSDSFVNSFTPPETTPMIQAEEARISMIEVRIWGCIELSKLPSSTMPASLVFLLKMMSLSDKLSVLGSSISFEEWRLPEIRWSMRHMITMVSLKYKGFLIFRLAKLFGASNIWQSPINPLFMTQHMGQHIVSAIAEVLGAMDLSLLTMDEEYKQERKQQESEECVDSLADGVTIAFKRLVEGFYGITDVVVKPVQTGRKKGLRGVPEACCRGLISGLVKPLDGLRLFFRALLQGVAACIGCRLRRRRNTKQRDVSDRDRDDRPQSTDSRSTLSTTASDAVVRRESELSKSSLVAAQTSADKDSEPPNKWLRMPDPFLRGADCLRMPRLLFGNGAALKPYASWHAELLAKLGEHLTEGIFMVWRLAGSEQDLMHIVLCASHSKLLLVDLGHRNDIGTSWRSSRRPSMSKDAYPQQVSIAVHCVQRSADSLRGQSHVDRAKAKLRRRSGRFAPGAELLMPETLLTPDWTSQSLFWPGQHPNVLWRKAKNSLVLDDGISSAVCCCRRRNRFNKPGEQDVWNTGAAQVLGAWFWEDLTRVSLEDLMDSVSASRKHRSEESGGDLQMKATSSSFALSSFKTSGTWRTAAVERTTEPLHAFLAQHPRSVGPQWVLNIEAHNSTSEWPMLPGLTNEDTLKRAVADVNQVITDMRDCNLFHDATGW